jgi:hypothetical protein
MKDAVLALPTAGQATRRRSRPQASRVSEGAQGPRLADKCSGFHTVVGKNNPLAVCPRTQQSQRHSRAHQAESRSYCSRAHVTPTIFVNDDSWAHLCGNEEAWMQSYFDGLLYPGWGSHVLKTRLAARLIEGLGVSVVRALIACQA